MLTPTPHLQTSFIYSLLRELNWSYIWFFIIIRNINEKSRSFHKASEERGHQHTHTYPFTRECYLSFQADPPLRGRATPLQTDHSSVERPPWCGKGPLWDRPCPHRQATLLWTDHPSVERSPLYGKAPSGTGHPLWTAATPSPCGQPPGGPEYTPVLVRYVPVCAGGRGSPWLWLRLLMGGF